MNASRSFAANGPPRYGKLLRPGQTWAAFRRIDSPQSNARSMDFKRVAVDDARLTGKSSAAALLAAASINAAAHERTALRLGVVLWATRMDNRIVAGGRLAGWRGTFPRIPASSDVAIATAKPHRPGDDARSPEPFRERPAINFGRQGFTTPRCRQEEGQCCVLSQLPGP
jgi:hypothetical protein